MAKVAAHHHSQQDAVFQEADPSPQEEQTHLQQVADKVGREERRMEVSIRRRWVWAWGTEGMMHMMHHEEDRG